jgi:hypothetical protein
LAIVDLDKGTSRQPQRRDGVLIVGLGGAILVFAAAIWLSAPHRATRSSTVPQSSAAVAASAISRSSIVFVPATPPSAILPIYPPARPLALPANLDSVDLFLIPERITNENLIWTLRSIVRIRGSVGIASVEAPSIITWTEKGFQYWMISSTRTTDELIKIADDLR